MYQGLRIIPMHISDNLRNSAFIAFKPHWIYCCKNDFCRFTRKLALIVHYNLHCLSFPQNVQKMEYSVKFAWHALVISEFKQGLITFNILEFQQKSRFWEQQEKTAKIPWNFAQNLFFTSETNFSSHLRRCMLETNEFATPEKNPEVGQI